MIQFAIYASNPSLFKQIQEFLICYAEQEKIKLNSIHITSLEQLTTKVENTSICIFYGLSFADALNAFDRVHAINEKTQIISITNQIYDELNFFDYVHTIPYPIQEEVLFKKFTALLLSMQNQSDSLLIKYKREILQIDLNKIEYIEVINHSVTFHLTNGKVYDTIKPLSYFEAYLISKPQFIKIHRSYIVNFQFVSVVQKNRIIMSSSVNLPIAKQYQLMLKKDLRTHFLYDDKVDSPQPVEQNDLQPDILYRILFVDDDKEDQVLWKANLESKHCLVDLASNQEEALMLINKNNYDCIILDVYLKIGTGIEFSRQLQKLTSTPILFLSAYDNEELQLDGFENGGIDYISKSLSFPLFWKKLDLRLQQLNSTNDTLIYGSFQLSLKNRTLTIHQKTCLLNPIEFDILTILAYQPNVVHSVKDIYHAIWGESAKEDYTLVQIYITSIRRKLMSMNVQHNYIEAVQSKGYLFKPVMVKEYA